MLPYVFSGGLRMSLIEFLKSIWKAPADRRDTETEHNEYPIHDGDFFQSITWECTTCGQEIYWLERDDQLTCHNCSTTFMLSEDNFPILLRAKCWNCGTISDDIGGFRMENIRFDRPKCEFSWKSSPW